MRVTGMPHLESCMKRNADQCDRRKHEVGMTALDGKGRKKKHSEFGSCS